MNLPEKRRIRAAFDRAASGYDTAARLQREVCTRLLARLAASGMAPPAQTLDAGCGTGHAIRLLHARWPQTRIVAADFAPAMAAASRRNAPAGTLCAVADIEALPFAAASFNLWWSSLAVQWCDAGATLAEAARVLRTDGRLALSTLGTGTFTEMRTAFAEVDRHRHTLDFSAAESLVAAAQAAGLREPELTRETLTLHYPDLGQLLGAVKAIGANALGEGRRRGLMGKAAWQALTDAYERQRTAEGLPASYDVILLTAKK